MPTRTTTLRKIESAHSPAFPAGLGARYEIDIDDEIGLMMDDDRLFRFALLIGLIIIYVLEAFLLWQIWRVWTSS
jgi:hypothetical protein